MPKEYLDLKMDFMFKQLFGHPSRKYIRIAFLNGLLNRIGRDRIVDVQYENTELPKETEDGKMSRLDVLVFTNLANESTLKSKSSISTICQKGC
jgi:predicted transposase/invertase (TIGR01784 family)